MKQSKISVVVSLLLLGAVACGSDSGGDDTDSNAGVTGSSSDAVSIFPPKIFTGYLAGKTYQAPAIAHGGAGAVEWSVEDPALLKLEKMGDNVMLTTLGDGTTNLVLKRGGKTARSAASWSRSSA